jgi:hypothetical protein
MEPGLVFKLPSDSESWGSPKPEVVAQLVVSALAAPAAASGPKGASADMTATGTGPEVMEPVLAMLAALKAAARLFIYAWAELGASPPAATAVGLLGPSPVILNLQYLQKTLYN